MVASKVRKKNDLPVSSGETVSIIRTTNCPKGRWLARDANHKYGYISVMNVELNIKEMLELGKKAQAAGKGGNADGDNVSIGSRSSNYPVLTSSFTDDSEEWACEDEMLSPSTESHFHQQTVSMPEMKCSHVGAQHTLSDANLEDLHTHEQELDFAHLELLPPPPPLRRQLLNPPPPPPPNCQLPHNREYHRHLLNLEPLEVFVCQ
ncbi:unnamed protein product [Merluccius merluccius]